MSVSYCQTNAPQQPKAQSTGVLLITVAGKGKGKVHIRTDHEGQLRSRVTALSLTSAIDGLNPLNPELNPICYLLALLGAHHFLHLSRTRVKLLTFRLLMSYIYGAPILDVSRSHTTTQHSR